MKFATRNLINAFKRRFAAHDWIDTIADGIGVRVPIPQAVEDLVSEDAIVLGMKLLHRHAGVVAEPSAALGIAALIEYPAEFRGRAVGTVVCGSNLTVQQMIDWL